MSDLKRGTKEHIRGFILSKLYYHGCVTRYGGKIRGHHSITNVKKGYRKDHRGKFDKILRKLKNEGLIILFPHSGDRDLHVSAVIDDDKIEKGLEIANKFRISEGLPPLNKELKEILTGLF